MMTTTGRPRSLTVPLFLIGSFSFFLGTYSYVTYTQVYQDDHEIFPVPKS